MNRAAITTAAAITAILLAGCSSTSTPKPASSGQAGQPAPAPTKAAATDASSAFTAIAAAVPSAKLGTTVTAENDPNHLLGRPNGYTSKITFTDSRIPAADTEGHQPGDLELGGSIEVFPTPEAAKARADYIQAAGKAAPAFAEYDYVHGTAVIRASRLLTPSQAADYEKAAAKLP